MAEADAPQIKRRKIFPQISPPKLNSVLNAANVLEESLACSLVLLKVTNSNASKSANFSTTCFLEFVRSCDVAEQPADIKNEVYYFGDIFAHGIKILKSFLKDQTNLPESKAECLSLRNLISVINNLEEITKRLSKVSKGQVRNKEERETLWTIELVDHLLKELAVNQSYVIDHHYRKKTDRCLCGEDITGQLGDCSIGNTEVWHGSVDILLGHSQDIALSVVTDEDEDPTESARSPSEIKHDPDLKSYYSQILAETIVFSLVQKKYNPQFENFLIPTIGISKKHLVFFFYDAEHDILLESSGFSLITQCYGEQQMIPYRTILALWLTINYRYFCTGITETMKTRGFTADFFKGVNEDKKHVYLNNLKIGGCQSEGAKYPSDYLWPQSDGPLYANKSKPYKPWK